LHLLAFVCVLIAAAVSAAYDFDFAASAAVICAVAVFLAIIVPVISVVEGFAFLTDIDYIVIMVFMPVYDIVFVNNIMFMCDYVLMFENLPVIGTAELLPVTAAISGLSTVSSGVCVSVISVTAHLCFPHFHYY
jgi:hypothetical protein